MAINRGAFILFEGCDRCGKTTQSRMLMEHLKASDVPAESMVFPNRSTVIGDVINQYLLSKKNMPDEAIHLLFSANRWESKNVLLDHLNAGKTVVVDRYSYSGVAYTVAKGLDYDWCMQPERGLIKPDAVIYLKTDVDEAMKRGEFGAERYEKAEFQRKVAGVFDRICALEGDTWHAVNANGEREKLHETIRAIAEKVIADVRDKPLQVIA